MVRELVLIDTAPRWVDGDDVADMGVVDDKGALVGMMTHGDTRRLLASGKRVDIVDDAMTAGPKTITPDALAAAVLKQMNDRKITQIFVVNDALPVGLVHLHDILRAGVG